MKLIGIPISVAAIFALFVMLQIAAVSIIPRTAGFTNAGWTVACLLLYAVSIGALAHIVHGGQPLSVLIPLSAAVVPLATIAIGILMYGEGASFLRVALLCGACGVIGIASSLR